MTVPNIIKSISYATQLTVIGPVENGWYPVRLSDGSVGYAYAQYIVFVKLSNAKTSYSTNISNLSNNTSTMVDVTRSFSSKTVVIRSVENGKYITNGISNTEVQCWRNTALTQEQYIIYITADGWAGFRSVGNSKYLSARNDKRDVPLEASSSQLQSWECFRIYQLGYDYYIKAQANNKYITAVIDEKNIPLKARADKPSTWERFDISIVNQSVNIDSDGDGWLDNEDPTPNQFGLQDGIVGSLQLCVVFGDGNPAPFTGHAYLSYTSFVNDRITLYGIGANESNIKQIKKVWKDNQDANKAKYSHDIPFQYNTYNLCKGDYITIGTWGGSFTKKNRGVYINYWERDYVRSYKSIEIYLNKSQLSKLESSTKKYCQWSLVDNCSMFADVAWYDVTGTWIKQYGFMHPVDLLDSMNDNSKMQMYYGRMAVSNARNEADIPASLYLNLH